MITASIVTYKTSDTDLRKVLTCVCRSVVSTIYIVDNSPTDRLKNFEIISPKIKYIFGQGNVGYGSAHNIAIRMSIDSGSKYHIVINPDIYFEDGTLERLSKYMEDNADVGQVMPKVIYPDGSIQYLCKMIPTPADLLFKRFIPSKITQKRLVKFQLRFTSYNEPMNVPYLSGCFMFFRIAALNKIGLFDERFFMYPEDIDMTRRMHRCYKTMFYPEITIVHDHAAASYKDNRMLKIHIVNMIKYFNKWGWLFDAERRETNRKLLLELNYKKK